MTPAATPKCSLGSVGGHDWGVNMCDVHDYQRIQVSVARSRLDGLLWLHVEGIEYDGAVRSLAVRSSLANEETLLDDAAGRLLGDDVGRLVDSWLF